MLAGKLFKIPVKGTHAHSFVTSFSTLDDITSVSLQHAGEAGGVGRCSDLLQLAREWRRRVSAVIDISPDEASDGELAALISYALAFPSGFMALVDTYDVKRYNFQGSPSRHWQRMNGHSGYNSNCGTNGTIAQSSPISYGISTVQRTLR